MSATASRGVKCSPASSLFSSLKRRISSSKIVPMPWLSSPGCRTVPSVSITGVRAQVDVGRGELFDQRAQQDVVPLGQRRGIWLRNSKLSRMSWTPGENPSRKSSKSALSWWRLARARRSWRVNFDVL